MGHQVIKQPDGGYRVNWARGRFDEAVALPAAPAGTRPPATAGIPPALRRRKQS